MQKTDNIYIDGLRFGIQHMQTGITFNEMLEHLKNIGWTIETPYVEYLYIWFFKNFYEKTMYAYFVYGNPSQIKGIINEANNYRDLKCLITSEAFETYQDFEKLKQAKADSAKALENSDTANKLARRALYIAIVVGICQILLQIYSTFADNNHFCLWCVFK